MGLLIQNKVKLSHITWTIYKLSGLRDETKLSRTMLREMEIIKGIISFSFYLWANKIKVALHLFGQCVCIYIYMSGVGNLVLGGLLFCLYFCSSPCISSHFIFIYIHILWSVPVHACMVGHQSLSSFLFSERKTDKLQPPCLSFFTHIVHTSNFF